MEVVFIRIMVSCLLKFDCLAVIDYRLEYGGKNMKKKYEQYIQEQLLNFLHTQRQEVINIYDKKSSTGYRKLQCHIMCKADVVPEVGKIRRTVYTYNASITAKISRIKPKLEQKSKEIFMSSISLDKFKFDTLSVECEIYSGDGRKKGSMTVIYSFCPTQFFYSNGDVRDEWYYKLKNNEDIQKIIRDIRKEMSDGLRENTSVACYCINNILFSTLGYTRLNEHQTKMLALVVYDELQYDYIHYDNEARCYYLSNDKEKNLKAW